MASIKRWGELPILFDQYGVSASSASLYMNTTAHMVVYNYIQTLGETVQEQAAQVRNEGFKMLGYGQNIQDNEVLCSIPLSPKQVLNPPTATTIQIACNGRHTSFGETVLELGYAPNLVLQSSANSYAGHVPTGVYYLVGVALYSNATPGVGDTLVGVAPVFVWVASDNSGWLVLPSAESAYAVSTLYLDAQNYNVIIATTDPDYGPESDPDGYGQGTRPAFDHTSVTIGIPDAPSVSTSSVGFMNVHVVSAGALATLGQYLFPTIGNITDVESALRTLVGVFYSRDSIQYIVDLHAIPVTPTTAGSKYIKLGSIETDISQPYCSTDYVDFDCGSISIPEQYTNFVDYCGTTLKLFLPFVGFVNILPEYWNGGTLSVKYRFNIIDGSFMAYVRATSSKSNLYNSLIGQYGGCACLHLPVVATSYGALVSGIVSGSMSSYSGKGGALVGAATGALSAYNFQGDMQQSNNYNCSTSFLGGRQPYVLIEREVPSFSSNYRHDKGLPLNVSLPLSSVHGFTVIEDIDLSGITGATENELAELRTLLREGVYF